MDEGPVVVGCCCSAPPPPQPPPAPAPLHTPAKHFGGPLVYRYIMQLHINKHIPWGEGIVCDLLNNSIMFFMAEDIPHITVQ